MTLFPSLRGIAAALLGLALAPAVVHATPVDGSATGLASPAVTITFDEHVLDQNTAVTSEYADLGVTFSPYLFYSPDDPDGPYATRAGNFLGNFADGSGQDPTQFEVTFSSLQTRAAFGMQSNRSSWLFEALLAGVVVEDFTTVVTDAYYGFEGITFDAIRVSSVPLSPGDYMGFDFLQFGAEGVVTPSDVPEPASIALLGLGALGLAHARRRARSLATA